MVIMKPSDLVALSKPAQTVGNIISPSEESLGGELDGLVKILDSANNLISKIVSLKGNIVPPQPKEATTQMNLKGSPAQISSGIPKNPLSQQKKEKEVVNMNKKLSSERIKNFVWDLMINQTKKIPPEVLEMKIEDVVGENFKKFNFKYMRIMKINSTILVDIITKQLIKIIPEFYEYESEIKESEKND